MAGAGILGGIAGAVALFFAYRAGVFMVGLLSGVLVSHAALADAAYTHAPWVILGAGIAGGVAALLLERPIVTLATAILGAWLVVVGIAFFAVGPGSQDTADAPTRIGDAGWVVLAGWALLAAVGASTQFAARRAKPKPRREN